MNVIHIRGMNFVVHSTVYMGTVWNSALYSPPTFWKSVYGVTHKLAINQASLKL